MKTRSTRRDQDGFTLIELLVAMAITTLIVTVLVSITAVAMDAWNRSRSELRASRQAKAMVDVMAKDFESMVARRNNAFEWLVVKQPAALPGSTALTSTNAAEMVFFTAPMDRYDGDLDATTSKGDVCGVGYLLDYKDPITSGGTEFLSFVLNRHVVDPDDTFQELLGKGELYTTFKTAYRDDLEKTENFICENIYQFTVVFHVEWIDETGLTPVTKTSQVTVGPNGVSEFRFKGTGIEVVGALPAGVTADQLKGGRLKGVEISVTVLSDAAMTRIRKKTLPTNPAKLNEFLSSNSHNYSKFITLSSM